MDGTRPRFCCLASSQPFHHSPSVWLKIGRRRYDGLHESFGGGAGGGELTFQLIRQGHMFIDFGDNATLFDDGWKWDKGVRKLGTD